MKAFKRVIAIALVLAAVSMGAHADPPVPDGVPPVPALPEGVPSAPAIPDVTPPAPPAVPNGAPSCEAQRDAGETAQAASALPRTAVAAACEGAVATGSSPEADAADWYWFRVTSTTAAAAIVVRPAGGGDVDVRMIGTDGHAIASTFRGGVDQPHVFVLDPATAVPGTYRVGVFPGRDGASSYTILAALPEL